MEKENKYFYVVECVKLKEENDQLVIDYTYKESTKLFDSLEKATKYYDEMKFKADENLGYLLIKVSETETEETLSNYTYEFDDNIYYYVDELKSTF